jgi:hypothetical protein
MRQEGEDLDNVGLLQITVRLRLLSEDLSIADQKQQTLIACLTAKELEVAAPDDDCVRDLSGQWPDVISHASFGGLE